MRWANTEHIAWIWAALIGVVVAGSIAAAILLARFDRVASRARRAEALTEQTRRELVDVRDAAAEYIGEIRVDVALCRQRTESLRGVLEILIPSGVWPERVKLPDPPPGWAPWPTGNKHGYEPEN